MSSGSVTFSFDCEGKWGMADHPRDWDIMLKHEELIKTYDFILKTLQANNLPATFAFVGALTETREEFLDQSLQKLTSKRHKSWLKHSKDRINKEEGWFIPELMEMVLEYDTHEIASHSYTHIPFNTLSVEEARIELGLVKSWAENKNIECKTMVYPRNINLLESFGILAYRDIPISILTGKFPRILKTLIDETWILQKAQQIEHFDPFKIPGGVFINWRHGFRNCIPQLISLLKYKSMINDSKLRNRVAHFWIHPHNFITSPSTKTLFVKLCEEVSMQRDNSSLVVKKQNDYLG